MSLSVLIVNWNSKDYLRKCIHSIHATCPELKPQIVVVDGGSFDGCGEMLASKFPNVQFLQSDQNLGFAQSNNLGFEAVRGDFMLLINPDTELCEHALATLVSGLSTLPHAGLVAPRLLNADGSLQDSCVQALPTPLNQVLDSNLLRKMFPRSRLWGTAAAFASPEPTPVEAVSGACMLLRSDTFRRVGGFSPQFFMYGEDIDLCSKIRRLNLDIFHVPSSKVIHYGGGSSSGSPSYLSAVQMRESLQLLIRDTKGSRAAKRYRLLMAISALLRLPAITIASLAAPACQKLRLRNALSKWTAILHWSLFESRNSLKRNRLNP